MSSTAGSKQNFLKLLVLFTAIILPWVLGILYYRKTGQNTGFVQVKVVNYKRDTIAGADHSRFEVLQQDFETPESVTEACLSCHNSTAADIMKTSHWKWDRDYITTSGDTIRLGKKNILNNFCIGVTSNEPRCTSCHIGYGWENDGFDFTDERRIDCLVCHDRTGTYKKFPSGAGYPVKVETVADGITYYPPDYQFIAAHVGSPGRQNCGACHFTGGGGNNVKHGDIANEMTAVTRQVDVHMGTDGANMDCVDCHRTSHHNISGNLYSIASVDTNRVSCDQCHTREPHVNNILNRHTDRVACQTCHIPLYAKVSATKMTWDWSTAGRFNEDGSFRIEKDSMGNVTYHTMKGSFVWENNVIPEYQWFNGNASHYVQGDRIDTSEVVKMNVLQGSYKDQRSKIIPVKVHRSKLIYDAGHQYLIGPHLFGKDSMAYWKNFDWIRAAKSGMEKAGMAFSGKYGFTDTEMSWPINHMVAPAEESLKCADCHSRDSRLIETDDFYLAGRNHNRGLDLAGISIVLLSLAGVMVHAGVRIFKNAIQK